MLLFPPFLIKFNFLIRNCGRGASHVMLMYLPLYLFCNDSYDCLCVKVRVIRRIIES